MGHDVCGDLTDALEEIQWAVSFRLVGRDASSVLSNRLMGSSMVCDICSHPFVVAVGTFGSAVGTFGSAVVMVVIADDGGECPGVPIKGISHIAFSGVAIHECGAVGAVVMACC